MTYRKNWLSSMYNTNNKNIYKSQVTFTIDNSLPDDDDNSPGLSFCKNGSFSSE